MTFGNALLVLSMGREEPLYKDYVGSSFGNVVLN